MPAASREVNARSLVGKTSAELLGEKEGPCWGRGDWRNLLGAELGRITEPSTGEEARPISLRTELRTLTIHFKSTFWKEKI